MDSEQESQSDEELLRVCDALEEDNRRKDIMHQLDRPSVSDPALNSKKHKLIFQQIELDSYIVQDKPTTKRPVIRMYGSTQDGHSVCCHVNGFLPYFYIAVPERFSLPIHCQQLKAALNQALTKDKKNTEAVVRVELVHKMNMHYYRSDDIVNGFAKITISLPNLLAPTKRLLETAKVPIPITGQYAYGIFEANLDYETRFMIDCGVVGCNWIELPVGDYSIRRPNAHMTSCQLEVDIAFDAMISHSSDGEWGKIAPFRILSFDIECAGRKGIFPEPDKDPVIQIANMISIQGETEPFMKTIFTLKECAPIMDAIVKSYDSEIELLEEWAEFIRRVDPDLITGYNIKNFDFWYLIKRATHLKKSTKFPCLGRVNNVKSIVKDVVFQSKQTGQKANKSINMEGRVIFDMYQILINDFKLRSYSLNSVSFHFLGEQKEDVHHSQITDLQNGDNLTRRRLAIYCLKDALLPLRLLDKLMCLINYIEMARVTGVTLQTLLTRGQQVKVVSQLLRKAKEFNYVMPTFLHNDNADSDQQFEGATVIEPVRGYYDVPIATLDFASLYPSIMQAHNLCYSTLMTRHEIDKMHPDNYIRTPSNNCFVKPCIRKGILPLILEDLLTARTKAKNELKIEQDPFKRKVLDGRQLALKISANSVYGFTGTGNNGLFPCIEISQSVTAYGRAMIDTTQRLVEEKFRIVNGCAHDAKVIYGDTDSVMVRFGVSTVAEAMALGHQAAKYISTTFPTPIKLEFEKVYFPYLLINKKRYAGLYFTKPDVHDKMDCKGLELVRRDNCKLVATVMNVCLEKILIYRDPMGAVEMAKNYISALLCNKVDISQLIISKELTKSPEDYAAKQAHVMLAEKMKKRDPGTAPKLGDRIPYVITKAEKGSPLYQRAEDPMYVLENSIPIDYTYYLENQLANPLTRIFEPILGNKTESTLLRGDHTREKVLLLPKVGPLSRFTEPRSACIGCKSILHDQTMALCEYCIPNETGIYMDELEKLASYQTKLNRIWAQCQRCQGSLHEEVICTNRDCPVFYMRQKVVLDCAKQDAVVRRFD